MKKLIEKHIRENIRLYFILSLILILGIFAGIFWFNYSGESKMEEIQQYLNSFITKITENKSINYFQLLQTSLKSNALFTCLIIFISFTIFGIYGVGALLVYKGFCLGYAISSIIATFGQVKGTIISITLIFLNQLILIPTFFFIASKSIKLFEIITQKNNNNVRVEIIKYSIYITIVLMLIVIASLIETFINSNLFLLVLKFI